MAMNRGSSWNESNSSYPGMDISAVGMDLEGHDSSGSHGSSREPLMTRFLRWLYPDQRRSARHTFPPLVSHLGSMKSALSYPVGDISAGGFFMITRERWLPGTEMPVTLRRTDNGGVHGIDTITVLVRVIRIGSDGVGFSFLLSMQNPAPQDPAHPGVWADQKDLDHFLAGLDLNESDEPELEHAS